MEVTSPGPEAGDDVQVTLPACFLDTHESLQTGTPDNHETMSDAALDQLLQVNLDGVRVLVVSSPLHFKLKLHGVGKLSLRVHSGDPHSDALSNYVGCEIDRASAR